MFGSNLSPNNTISSIFLNTLTNMIHSKVFIHAASWIISMIGHGINNKRISTLWKCMIDVLDVTHGKVRSIFVQKRDYVKQRYWDDEPPIKLVSTSVALAGRLNPNNLPQYIPIVDMQPMIDAEYIDTNDEASCLLENNKKICLRCNMATMSILPMN